MNRFRPVQVLSNMRVVGGTARVAVAQRQAGRPVRAEDVDVDRDPALENAYEQGFAAGRRAAEEALGETVRRLEDRLAQVGEDLPASLTAWLGELEKQAREEVCELAFAVAERLLRRELQQPEACRRVVAQALGPLLDFHGVVIRLNPGDAEHLTGSACGILPPGVTVRPDATLGPGEAMVETPHGMLDATVHSRLATLRELLDRELAEDTEEPYAATA